MDLPAHLIDLNIERTYGMGAYRTSMHVDRSMARPMEVEAILGAPARVALMAGIHTPALQQVYEQAALVAAGIGSPLSGRGV